MSDLMRKEFEAAFVAEEVRLCGEGMRSSALYMVEQDTVNVRCAWWAWQASRGCLVINLPPSIGVAPIGGDGIQEFIDCNGEYLHGHLVVDALTAAGVKYK